MTIHPAVNQSLGSPSRTSGSAVSPPRLPTEESFAAILLANRDPVPLAVEKAAAPVAAVPPDTRAASLAAERNAAARAALGAGGAAITAVRAVEAVDAVARGSASLAIDAAAKFMGAGAMGQGDLGLGLARAVSPYPMVIPMVTGAAQAADSHGSSQHRAPTRKTRARLAFRFRVEGSGSGSSV
jgi:hypothetical protein